ncbi:MAG: hypothetical protein U0521_14330 [Anaerolineae bacterium]
MPHLALAQAALLGGLLAVMKTVEGHRRAPYEQTHSLPYNLQRSQNGHDMSCPYNFQWAKQAQGAAPLRRRFDIARPTGAGG